MGTSAIPQAALWCTVATIGLLATPRLAAAQGRIQAAQIVVGEGALSDDALAQSQSLLSVAIDRFHPEDPVGFRVQVSLYLRGPGLLDASLVVTSPTDGTMLAGFTVRSSGRGTPDPVLIRAAIDRLIDDAAVTLGWPKKR